MSQIPATGLPQLDMFSAASGLASGGPSSAESGDIYNRSRNLGGDTSFGGINNAASGLNTTTIAIAVGVLALFFIARKTKII
jgi:hypothetical protein